MASRNRINRAKRAPRLATTLSARAFLAALIAWTLAFGPWSLVQWSGSQQAFAQEQDDEAPPADESEDEPAEEADEPAEEAPSAAQAQTPTLFLLPVLGVEDQVSGIIPERIGEVLRSELQGKRGVDLLAPYDVLAAQSGGSANAAVSEATKKYTSGIGLLSAGENKRAARSFQEAVDTLEENLGDLDNFNILVDAYKNMALAYFLADFDFDARKAMQVFAHLSPEEVLDEEKFPEELRELYNSEAQKVQKAGTGELTITADVDEAMVTLDGVARGTTPAQIDDVGYGYHYVVVRGADGTVWSEQIRVRGRDQAQTIEANLGGEPEDGVDQADSGEPAFYAGLLSALKSGQFELEDVLPYLQELESRAGASDIAWVLMTKQKSDYVATPFIYNGESGELFQGDEVVFMLTLSNLRVGVNQLANQIMGGLNARAEDKLVASVDLLVAPAAAPVVKDAPPKPEEKEAASSAPAPATVTPPPVPEDEPEDEDGSSPWLWVGIGSAVVVAAGLVVGGVLLLGDEDGSGGSGQFDATLSW